MDRHKLEAFLTLFMPGVRVEDLDEDKLAAVSKAISEMDEPDSDAIQKAIDAVEADGTDEDETPVQKGLLSRITSAVTNAIHKAFGDEDDEEFPIDDEAGGEDLPVDPDMAGNLEGEDDLDLDADIEAAIDDDAVASDADDVGTPDEDVDDVDEDDYGDDDEEFARKSLAAALDGLGDDVEVIDGELLMQRLGKSLSAAFATVMAAEIKPLNAEIKALKAGMGDLAKSLEAVAKEPGRSSPYATLMKQFSDPHASEGGAPSPSRGEVIEVTQKALAGGHCDLSAAEADALQKAAGTADWTPQHGARFRQALAALEAAGVE